MKQNDWTTIIIIIFISVVLSFLLTSKVLVTPKSRQQQVETVGSISPSFTQPDSKYFNAQAVDPTELIQIGNGSNQTPFGNGQPIQ